MSDLIERATELLSDDSLTNEYPSDWSIKLAQALATVEIARQLGELNTILKKATNVNGAFEAEIVKTVVTINENQL